MGRIGVGRVGGGDGFVGTAAAAHHVVRHYGY